MTWLNHGGSVICDTFSPLYVGFVPLRKRDRGGGLIRLITYLKSESTSGLILGFRNQQTTELSGLQWADGVHDNHSDQVRHVFLWDSVMLTPLKNSFIQKPFM